MTYYINKNNPTLRMRKSFGFTLWLDTLFWQKMIPVKPI